MTHSRTWQSRVLAPAIAAAAVAGCGGGGGGDAAAPAGGGADGGSGNAPPVTTPAVGTRLSAAPGCPLTYTYAAPGSATGADPLLSRQWHLQSAAGGTFGTGARDAWATTRGEGVRVAVNDVAVELLHEDLQPNLLPGASHNYRDGGAWPLPCESDDDHGTSVAGILLARDGNGLGVAGVAPRASLAGYNALATGTSADIADSMVRDLDDVAIRHNSWGSPDDGGLNPAGSAWESAVLDGLRNGRGGRGAVYVFSAGNGGIVRVPRSGGGSNTTFDISNFDAYVNKLGVIAACAVGIGGRSPDYAEPGANLLVCGPSSNGVSVGNFVGVTTTDLTGNGRYRDDFSGTSASAPMVSGVATLLLARRPDLTWRDVRLILAQSAREVDANARLGDLPENPARQAFDPAWLPSSLPDASAGGRTKRFSHFYGFGLVDAPAALALAAGWNSVGGSSTLKSCGPFGSGDVNLAIPDAGGTLTQPVAGAAVASTVDASACDISRIEFVEATVTIDHPYSAELAIELESPTPGRVSRLAVTRGCGTGIDATGANPCRDPYDGWRFGSARHMDEPAAGRWQLRVSDGLPRETGRLVSWSLRIWGR